MASETTALTIQTASAVTGLSVHTLRYYERIGLLTPIGRATNGHRRYSAGDIDRIKLLNKLLTTRMPLDQVRRYTALLAEGDTSIREREAILQAHRVEVQRQMEELRETLAAIDYKLALYGEKIKGP